MALCHVRHMPCTCMRSCHAAARRTVILPSSRRRPRPGLVCARSAQNHEFSVLRTTLDADKGYDVEAFAEELKPRGMRPHIARNITNGRCSAIDGRNAHGKGYVISLQMRKTNRAGLWRGQGRRRSAQVTVDRSGQGERLGEPELRSLQPDPDRRHWRVVESAANVRKGASSKLGKRA